MRYDIVVKGKVQDVGFRGYLVALANISELRGYIYNSADGTVRMILEGVKTAVSDFLNEVKSRKYLTGVQVIDIEKKELIEKFSIPDKFVRLSTDELYDIDRKLGVGNEILAGLKKDTGTLPEIKNGIDTLNVKFDSLNVKFDSFIEEQRGHNLRLEKILEKISEKI